MRLHDSHERHARKGVPLLFPIIIKCHCTLTHFSVNSRKEPVLNHIMSNKPIIEICCAGPDDVAAAVAGGASRIELCAALASEGVTPSPGMIAEALSIAGDVPVTVLVRPREGNFHYTKREVSVMIADVLAIKATGASGVTIGALDSAGMPDYDVLSLLIEAAGPSMQLTFHRAIDDCHDPVAAIETLARLGFHRVLTSGGAASAIEGSETIRRMTECAAGRLDIMPGGGVRPDNIVKLHSLTGANQFHSSARCKTSLTTTDSSIFGSAPATVDPDIVKRLVNNLNHHP